MKRKENHMKTDFSKVKTPFNLKLLRLSFRVGGTLAPYFIGKIAAAMMLKVRYRSSTPKEWSAFENAKITTLTIPNGKSFVSYSLGQENRPVVLLIHGWESDSARFYAFIEPLLSAGYRVVTLDAPAHGKSGGTHTNIAEFMAAIREVAKQYKEIHAIIGHSLGGASVMFTLARNPGFKVNYAVLLGSFAGLDDVFSLQAKWLKIPTRALHKMYEVLERVTGENVWDLMAENHAPNIKVPALIIHDHKDELIPMYQAQRINYAWQNSRLLQTEGLGHRRILRNREVVQAVLEFIDTAEQRRKAG
jgi:pimeloyl-ACP methyl ester carboxylesterase